MKLSTLIRAAGRELGMRRNVYPRRVQDRKMRMETAAEEIAAMETIHKILKAADESPNLREAIAAAGITLDPEQKNELL